MEKYSLHISEKERRKESAQNKRFSTVKRGWGNGFVSKPAFVKKMAVSKGRALGRSNWRSGGVGAAAPALNGVQKSFLSNFFQKKFEQTQFAELKLWIYK